MSLIVNSYASFPPGGGSGTYVAGAFNQSEDATTTRSITQADLSTVTSGNMLVCFLASRYDTKGGDSQTLPSGFTQRAQQTYGSGAGGFLYIGTRTAGGSEGTYTSGAGTNLFHSAMAIVEISGVTGYDVSSTVTMGATADDITIPSATATVAGFLVAFYFKTAPKTITSVSGTSRLTSSTPLGLLVTTEQLGASGATGTRVGDHDNASPFHGLGGFIVLS